MLRYTLNPIEVKSSPFYRYSCVAGSNVENTQEISEYFKPEMEKTRTIDFYGFREFYL